MFYKPDSLAELLRMIDKEDKKKVFLAGGTDINVMKKKGMLKDEDIFYINRFDELKQIKVTDDVVKIGALVTYGDLLKSKILSEHLPYLVNSLSAFASPLIQNLATIGGNIANASPTNDVSPLLLVLDAKLVLLSVNGEREVNLENYYTGYKKSVLKNNEIIKEILIKKFDEKNYITYYQKVASRNILAISKLSLAGIKKLNGDKLEEVKIAVGSLNEYPRRLKKTEEYLKGSSVHQLDFSQIRNILSMEITPISDFRSDKEYRFEVCQNLLIDFLSK